MWTGRKRHLAQGSSGLPGWGGAAQAKLHWLSQGCHSGSKQRLTCPVWAVARTRPLDFRRVAVVPDGSRVHRPSRGQLESGGDRPQSGLGDPDLRAPAHATQLACRSLRRRQSQPCSRPPVARGSREPPRGSDPAAEEARGCEGPGRVPSSPCPVRVGSAERNGAGRSAARAVPSLSERPPWRRGAVTQA